MLAQVNNTLSKYKIVILLLFATFESIGQSPVADFTVGLLPCLEQNIDVVNNSVNADSFEWDFCLDDFRTLTSILDLGTVTGLNGGYGYKIVEDSGLWYGFVVSQSTHSIIRLDFGDSPNNTPAIVNLGNPENSLLFPQGIELYKNNGTWFAFVGHNDNNYGLVRLNFGGSLTNIPTSLNIGNFGVTGRFWDLRIIRQAADLILVVIERNTGSIVRVNYRDSFLNAVTIPTHVFNTGPIPGAALTPGLDVAMKGSNWFVFLTSSSNQIYQISFGADILGTPTVDATYSLPSLNNPFRIKIAQEGDNYFAVVTNQTAVLDIIDLKDLNVANPPDEITFSGLPQLLGLDIIRYKGKSVVQGVGNLNNKLSQLLFEATCGASVSFSQQVSPNPVSYATAGVKKIELKVFNSTSLEQSIAARQITVSSLTAPDISFTSQNICANNDVNFTSENTSGDITDYNWDFDDTNTSMAQDPIHQFAAAGDYEVKLQVTASNGCNNLASETVTIYNEPVANFDLPSASPICTNQEYIFDNTTSFDPGSNPTWQWEVNGTPTSTVEGLTYQIPTATMQDIKLIASIPGCSSEITKTINTVEDGPLADFSFVNDCEDKSITFTNTTVGAVTGYSWDFGDGNTSGLTNGTNTFDDFGTYDVTLEATNAAGCINTSVQEITIYSKPQPDFSLDLPPFSCNGSPSQFNDLTPNPADSNLDSWVWSFGDPQSGSSLDRNPQYIYGDAGQYNVNLDVTTNFGCTASIQKMVTISQTPDANFSFNAACINQATSFTPLSIAGIDSWQWKVGVSTYNQQNPTHVFSTPSNYNVQLTANGANGCIGVKSQTINVPVPSTVDFSFENNCTNQDTQFTDLTNAGSDPVSARLWQFGSLGSANGATPSFSFPTAGSYPTKLTVTNQSGCSYSTTKIVNVAQSPVATFTATPQTGTAPLTVQLNNTSASSVSQLWTANDPTNAISTEKTTTFTFDKLGEYVVDLTIEDESGCTSVSSKIISVIIPTLDIELTQLTLVPSATGESNILLSLINKSNFPVNNIKAVIDISGEALISETITATIQPNEVYSQLLSVGIIGSKSGANYLCVELVVDGDANTLNNKKCLNNDAATVVMAPYPNPGSDNLNLEWISTAATSAEIHIFDPTGRKVYENMFFDLDPGLNHATISVGLLNPGMYYVFFVSGDVRRSFPFVVRR